MFGGRTGLRVARPEPDATLAVVDTQETALLTQLESTFARLDGWHKRGEQQVETPQAGSDLFEDDKSWAHNPISEVARLSLALSVDHLGLVRVMLDARQLFPSSPYTTLRGALVGAAQAVWVLGPQRRETRIAHGLAVIAEEYAQLAKFYSAVDELDPNTIPADQWLWLRSRRTNLAALRGQHATTKLNQTQMIEESLDLAFPSDAEKRKSGRLLWRQMSADAHVLGWAVSQRTHVLVAPGKNDPLAVLAAAGSLRHLSEPFLCAFELAKRGWSLFDQRCEAV